MNVKKEELPKIWHTKSCLEFDKMMFNMRLGYEHVVSDEMYLTVEGKNGKQAHLEGYVAKKTHQGNEFPTVYFIPTESIQYLPIIVKKTTKKHDAKKVYNVINDYASIKIEQKEVYTPRQLALLFGNPYHTNILHHTIHKYKRLIHFIEDGFTWRCVSESGFGKTVFDEALCHLTGEGIDVTSPSPAKLFWCIAKYKRVNVNEMPMAGSKEAETKLKNIMMCISQNSGTITNPSRSLPGVPEIVDISEHAVSFTHNVAQYYHSKNNKSFEEYFEYNVINRLYCQELKGNMILDDQEINYKEIAEKYKDFYIDFIKTLKYLKQHKTEFKNKYPEIDIDKMYYFPKKEDRFKSHFFKFSKWASHFAKDVNQYKMILDEDYKTHVEYKELIKQYEEK